MIKVLADYHHASLWESLCMLFEDRFDWELYRPVGMEWWDAGIWQWERHMPHGEPVAHQYLDPWPCVDRDWGSYSLRRDEMYPDRSHRLVTMEQAREMKPDIVLATLTENEAGWHTFAREVGAKFGIQVGNQGTANRYDLIDFAMFSTTREHPPWKPYVTYRQEFDLDVYRFEYPPKFRDYVGTWVQALPSDPTEYNRFLHLAADLPELNLRYHGHVGPIDDHWGGNVVTSEELATKMRNARVGLHCKTWSDGYGHVIHNLFSVGRPVVGTATYYADKLAGPLFVEGVTSFDVQRHSHAEVVDFIRRLCADDELHERMSRAAAARFREVVDFDAEAEEIHLMFDNVLSDAKVAVA